MPLPVAQVWQAVRESDHRGRKAMKAQFDPSVDCSVSLFIDSRKSDQLVRSAIVLAHLRSSTDAA